jgi:hypothetical protein
MKKTSARPEGRRSSEEDPRFKPAGLTQFQNAVDKGITGEVSKVRTVVSAAQDVKPLATASRPADVDLKNMAGWAMHYLISTPRKELGYEPVFQCHPLACPPAPRGQDPVVACDTDARMDWEWYYMREISGVTKGREIEAAFHQRMRAYVDPDGKVWSHPGCYNENLTTKEWEKKDYVVHIWGATKILKSLSEEYSRTKNAETRALATKVMQALRKLATCDDHGRCWFEGGMGALKRDLTPVPNGWNVQPAPIVEPLVTYWLATQDPEGLAFARAYADGMIDNCQPGAIRFHPEGTVTGGFGFGPHSHATMHAVWGVAHLGVVLDEPKYNEFARKVFDWMLTRGTGTGWFPAGPDNCNETCCISDMISVAALVGRAGRPEYYDYVERYMRNAICNLQFIVTPEFEAYYREQNKAADETAIIAGLMELRKFQGGVIGGSGLNDYENTLLGGASGFQMFGCCAPEGMRAIHTAWTNTIEHRDGLPDHPAGVYVNLSFSRTSPWGEVVSFMPDAGRLTVRAGVTDDFYLRPPHWASRDQLRAFLGTRSIPVVWSGRDYVRFQARAGDELTITYPLIEFDHRVKGLWRNRPDLQMTFHWRGNMVLQADPPGGRTPLFTGRPRVVPPVPE